MIADRRAVAHRLGGLIKRPDPTMSLVAARDRRQRAWIEQQQPLHRVSLRGNWTRAALRKCLAGREDGPRNPKRNG